MAISSRLTITTNSIPIVTNRFPITTKAPQFGKSLITLRSRLQFKREPSDSNGSVCVFESKRSTTRLNAAGISEIEPDLIEEKRDRWETNSISSEDFIYGEYDGHHTYHEGQEGTFWEGLKSDYAAAEPPTGFQGLMSWLFPPAIIAGMAFHVQGEYLYIGAAVFVVIFCGIEMAKPDKPHNFEPQIYNMERGARDKLIADYNTMDIWDFNEKYGDLWDFTINKETKGR